MRGPLTILLVSLAAFSCATPAEPPESHTPSARKLIILMYGFFNSEHHGRFDPEPIGYAFLSLEDAHGPIAERARALEWPTPVHVLSWDESDVLLNRQYSDEEREILQARLWEALGVLDSTVQTGQIPTERAIKLKAPFLPPEGWGAGDRVLSIVGLETVRRPHPKGLTSILGCFWFFGDGSYLGLLAAPYDFTRFGTHDLAATASDYCFRVSKEN